MNKSQIVIGTGSWGSWINFKESIQVSTSLLKLGLNHFDTAPLYGSGYSHYILNEIGKQNNILIDTKYGQNTHLNWRELFKRFYRFINFKTFKYSFKHIRFNKHARLKKDFWDIQKLNDAYNLFLYELDKCKITTFYLHGPPEYILDYKYLQNFSTFFITKGVIPGISSPGQESLDMLIEKFPNIKLQMPIEFFWKNKEKILKSQNKIDIFKIFKKIINDRKNSQSNDKEFWHEFLNIIEANSKYKLVLGINSKNSIEKLKKILENTNNLFNI